MSLGVAFKATGGVVLAADSRVTITAKRPDGTTIPAYFDNATKLLTVESQPFIGVVTYGQGAIGQTTPRTAHSYVAEFEDYLTAQGVASRLGVEEFATHLGAFFGDQWTKAGMPATADDMFFLVGGYDAGDSYGRIFLVSVPSGLTPREQSKGEFGLTWGGQIELASRVMNGFDPRGVNVVQRATGIDDATAAAIAAELQRNLRLPIPYQFLPLQDCVNLSMYLVNMTAIFQTWLVDVRGVGGAIDVATITREDGLKVIKRKEITAQF